MNDKSSDRRSATVARLAGGAVLFTWALLVVGAVVRVTGSGMGCPDWPKCFGQWLPPPTFAAWVEWTHRLLAALVSPLIVATAVVAWRRRGIRLLAAPSAWAPAAMAVVLLASQIVIGAITVQQANSPASVVAHLMNALLLLGALVVTWVRATRDDSWSAGLASDTEPFAKAVERRTPALARRHGPAIAGRLGLMLAAATLLLSLAGSMVQTTGGGFACLSFPLCNGRAWPADLGWPAEVHMLHRVLAVFVGVLLVALWMVVRPESAAQIKDGENGPQRRREQDGLGDQTTLRRARALLRFAFALYGMQFAVGVAQVMTGLPTALRGAHVALAGALWMAMVALATELVDAEGRAVEGVEVKRAAPLPRERNHQLIVEHTGGSHGD